MACKSGRERTYEWAFLLGLASRQSGDLNAEDTEVTEIRRRSLERVCSVGILRANHGKW